MKSFLVFLFCILLLAACGGKAPEQSPTITPRPVVPTAEPTATTEPSPTPEPAALGERSLIDRPDDQPGTYQIHVLYVTLLDSPDMNRDLDGKFDISVQAVNDWLAAQTGGYTLRFDNFNGALDITYVQLPFTNQEFIDQTVSEWGEVWFVRDELEQQLDTLGILQPGKIYTALFEISQQAYTCADGAHPPDLLGRVAGFYVSAILDNGYDCADEAFGSGISYADMGVAHEIVHLLGFASSCGQNPTSADNMAHTGDDNRDLMWAPSDTDTRYWDTDNMVLDPGNDDYYNIDIAGCFDLADSSFLDPLPADAVTPPDWPADWLLP